MDPCHLRTSPYVSLVTRMVLLATNLLPAGRQPAYSSRSLFPRPWVPVPARQHPGATQQQAAQAPPWAPPAHHRHHARPERRAATCAAGGANPQQQPGSDEHADAVLAKLAALADLNQLQTALSRAIAAEDWELAAKIRDLLRLLAGPADGSGGRQLAADWRGLGILDWLADRAENLGFAFPTGGHPRCACLCKQRPHGLPTHGACLHRHRRPLVSLVLIPANLAVQLGAGSRRGAPAHGGSCHPNLPAGPGLFTAPPRTTPLPATRLRALSQRCRSARPPWCWTATTASSSRRRGRARRWPSCCPRCPCWATRPRSTPMTSRQAVGA